MHLTEPVATESSRKIRTEIEEFCESGELACFPSRGWSTTPHSMEPSKPRASETWTCGAATMAAGVWREA
jgi:hypothetical protein